VKNEKNEKKVKKQTESMKKESQLPFPSQAPDSFK